MDMVSLKDRREGKVELGLQQIGYNHPILQGSRQSESPTSPVSCRDLLSDQQLEQTQGYMYTP